MDSRSSKAKTAFRKLKRIRGSKQYNRRTKIRLFNTLVKPVLLYGSETWKTNVQDNRKLDSFQYQCLKRSLGIFWPYIVSIDELNERTRCTRMRIEVKRRRWRFLGHVLRMPREHHCATALTYRHLWAKGKSAASKPPGAVLWRKRGQWRAESLGRKREPWLKIGKSGRRVVQPYAQQSAKGIGEVIGKKC